MTLYAVTHEIDRLSAIGNRYKLEPDGTRAIARALEGITGVRQSMTDCALSRHLQRFTTQTVRTGRYEVFVGETRIPLNDPPGDRLILRQFVCDFDDKPGRFPHLRER